MTCRVDLLVPTFNNEATVEDTLNSLLSQTHKNCRIIVFDNQSTDQTVAKVQPYTTKGIGLVINEKNLGGEGNFNRCIERAEAPYFCICHSDDIYDSRFVEVQLQALESELKSPVSFCHADRIDFAGQSLGERFLPEELDDHWRNSLTFPEVLRLAIRYGNIFTCPTAFFRTSVFKDYQLRFEGSKYRSSSDLGLWLTLSKYGPVLFHTAPLLRYRESNFSFSFSLKKARTHRHDLFLVLDDFTSSNEEELEEYFSDWKRYFQFLEFKDQMLRSFNVIKMKSWTEWPEDNFSIFKALSVILSSTWHFSFGLKALAIYVTSRLMRWKHPPP